MGRHRFKSTTRVDRANLSRAMRLCRTRPSAGQSLVLENIRRDWREWAKNDEADALSDREVWAALQAALEMDPEEFGFSDTDSLVLAILAGEVYVG